MRKKGKELEETWSDLRWRRETGKEEKKEGREGGREREREGGKVGSLSAYWGNQTILRLRNQEASPPSWGGRHGCFLFLKAKVAKYIPGVDRLHLLSLISWNNSGRTSRLQKTPQMKLHMEVGHWWAEVSLSLIWMALSQTRVSHLLEGFCHVVDRAG